MSSIKEYEDSGTQKVSIDTQNGAVLVGTFYDNPNAKSGVVLLPGITEHRSSLGPTAQALNENHLVWTFDLNSQGESTGDWNLVQMYQSVNFITQNLATRHGLEKIGAHGNSAGGMAVGITAAKYGQLDAICLTSTPAALQDVAPSIATTAMKVIPQSLVRQVTILFDKLESRNNESYRAKTHSQFKTKEGYQNYAQLGATKISSLRDMAVWIEQAPRLDEHAQGINTPTLMIYGADDGMLGIKNGQLPPQLYSLSQSIPGELDLLVIPGADHPLNLTKNTKTDECFNKDPELEIVREAIVNHFGHYLL